MNNRRFPLFVETGGRKAIVLGAGNVGMRRINTLVKFDFKVTVIEPNPCEELHELEKSGKVELIEDTYKEEYIKQPFIFTSCTNDSFVNRMSAMKARQEGAYVSVSDDKLMCDFFFPAIAMNEDVTVGLVGDGKCHKKVKDAAAKIRSIIEEE